MVQGYLPKGGEGGVWSQGGGVRSQSGWSGGGMIPITRGQTDICENITFPQLRLRAVNIFMFNIHSVVNGIFKLINMELRSTDSV